MNDYCPDCVDGVCDDCLEVLQSFHDSAQEDMIKGLCLFLFIIGLIGLFSIVWDYATS